MPVFWTLYWLGFLGFPLMFLIASMVLGSGAGSSGTHIWVYKSSNRKVRDASVKEVWQRQHSGKSWKKHEQAQFTGCIIVQVIGFLIFLIWLASELFTLPENQPGLRIFWQVGAPILGGLSSGAFIGIQSLITNYKSAFLKILHIIALVLMGIGVIGGLVLTFIGIDLPISHHWIWAPAGATGVLLIIQTIFSGVAKGKQRKKQDRASASGGNLMLWVAAVMDFSQQYDIKNLDAVMKDAVQKLQWGELDDLLWEQDFFDRTESIILDLVNGRQLSIQMDEIYQARESIIKAVQAFYFYSVKNISRHTIHPQIEKALK